MSKKTDWAARTDRFRNWLIWCNQQEFTGDMSREDAIKVAESICGAPRDGKRDYPSNEELETWCPAWNGQ